MHFCDKSGPLRTKVNHQNRREELMKVLTVCGENAIHRAVQVKQDMSMKIKTENEDLIAREAQYHPSCRRKYLKGTSDIEEKSDITQPEASSRTFKNLCYYIDNVILKEKGIKKLQELFDMYISDFESTYPELETPSYIVTLERRLKRHYGDTLRFHKVDYHTTVVYHRDTDPNQFDEISKVKQKQFLAKELRDIILKTRKASPNPTIPMTKDNLTNDDIKPPFELLDFLSYLVCDKPFDDITNPKKVVLVNSIAQDISYAVTNGSWKMPKHVSLAMAVRHLTGSAELVTILNRFGHCQSYQEVIYNENEIANDITLNKSVIPPEISRTNNRVLHTAWDNFDMCEETPSGANTTHTTHGIVIQEKTQDNNNNNLQPDPVPNPINRRRTSFKYTKEELEECYTPKHPEPNIVAEITVKNDPELLYRICFSHFLWVLSRKYSSESIQIVPGWAGWVSLSGNSPHAIGPLIEMSNVQYMPPLLKPITDNSTVLEVLKISQSATKEVSQSAKIITMDLAAAKKANHIIWNEPDRFKDVIVRYGVFHTSCSALHAIGKMLRGSGFSEIVIESGICASGSVEGVLSGKHYNRSIRVHKIVLESLERCLITKFEESFPTPALTPAVKVVLDSLVDPNFIDSEKIQNAMQNVDMRYVYEKFQTYKNDVRSGKHGQTAQFWLSYMDEIWLILSFIRATKENDFDLHVLCLQDLCPLYFAADQQNYAKYLTLYYIVLLNLRNSNPEAESLLRDCGFSVCRSKVPTCRNPVDMTIEQTINKDAKSAGGLTGFSLNQDAYYRWCITRHQRALYVKMALEMSGIEASESDTHKDLAKAQILTSEEEVKNTISAINSFLNPFTVEDPDHLYCLSSGEPVPSDVAHDLLDFRSKGKEAFTQFIQERLVAKTQLVHAPIKRMKLKTFQSTAKTATVKNTQNKLIQIRAERNIFGQLVMLAEENKISVQSILQYPLSPVPWALGTPTGLPVKTDKSALMHHLEKYGENVTKPKKDTTDYIYDGNALFHALSDLPSTFAELADMIFNILPKGNHVEFICDDYHEVSIKEPERRRRGVTQPFIIKGRNTKVPRKWNEFLSNDKNKEQLCQLLIEERQRDEYAERIKGRTIYFAASGRCHIFTSDGNVVSQVEEPSLTTTQEEADTKIILHATHLSQLVSLTHTIMIRSPDTDVLVLLVHHAHRIPQSILLDTGTGNNRRLVDVTGIASHLGSDICDAIPAIHAFTGCDSVSAMVRRGKAGPFKIMVKNKMHISSFQNIGLTPGLNEDNIVNIEKFVCQIYGKPKITDINLARYMIFKEKFQSKTNTITEYEGTDISLLPLCKDSLIMHLTRANYQALIWRFAHVAAPVNIPSPVGNGWYVKDGLLEIQWSFSQRILPQELVDVISPEEQIDKDQDENDDSHQVNSLIDEIYSQ